MKNVNSAPSILVVEDDSTTCVMLGTIIRHKFPDAVVYLAENGSIGAELFKEHAPELVITDINMPVMDGIEMADRIKAVKADARFIVITAYSDRGYFERFSEIGFCEYLLKPVQFPALFAAIEKCLAEVPTKQ
jgi:YesN/AraC family two-component response regulator